ncbi:hypothetical protein CTAYLR_000490 [Chrysophaeum taylorii]|uniref:Metallo-beta-lactamase domain-containing protein n=1 Tax=Chrysophaeum taylorii TaxID=2483200 RepID=A0AAD7UII0_9STRA|nr:hypothetical protein CTAYLR_000490 [Chrysophaeum taylorii]
MVLLVIIALEAAGGFVAPLVARGSTRRWAVRIPEVERNVVEFGTEAENVTSYHAACAPGEKVRRSRLARLGEADMEVVFLGTASCIPSATRGVSCSALRFGGQTLLFDCGEGTQIQMQRSNRVRPGSVTAVFVTHAHGDHTFGLPGLLCLLGQNREPDAPPIDVYGPQGLRFFARAALQLTHSRAAAPYRIHELLDVPFIPPRGYQGPTPPKRSLKLAADQRYGELPGGVDVAPDANGVWTIRPPGSDLVVRAAPMVHTVPCVGYVVQEPDRPGKLDVSKVEPVLEKNFDAFKSRGVKHPKKVYQVLKEMRPDQCFTFPDGTKVYAADCVAPREPGRVVAICGDTADARRLAPLLEHRCDLLVHEATNAFLGPPFDDPTKISPALVRRATEAHGHSTPEMAARFANEIRARRLVLTHFSPRYKGDALPTSLHAMRKIELKAKLDHGAPVENPDPVLAAWDLSHVPVPRACSATS